MRAAKYARQDYKTYEDILSEIKINPVVKKIQNYRYKWVQHVQRMDRDRRTDTLNCEMLTVWETKPRKSPQQTSGLLVGPEQGTKPETLPDISTMMKRMTTTMVVLKTRFSCDMTAVSLGK
jgi:hypothetical protein